MGVLTFQGKRYALDDRCCELHVPPMGTESRGLYFVAGTEAYDGVALALWEVEAPLLDSVEALDGQCLHVRFDNDLLPGDSLGTDLCGMSDLTYFQLSGRNYAYATMKIVFHRLEGARFRCIVDATVYESDEDVADVIGRDDLLAVHAEVDVTADERNPHDD